MRELKRFELSPTFESGILISSIRVSVHLMSLPDNGDPPLDAASRTSDRRFGQCSHQRLRRNASPSRDRRTFSSHFYFRCPGLKPNFSPFAVLAPIQSESTYCGCETLLSSEKVIAPDRTNVLSGTVLSDRFWQ